MVRFLNCTAFSMVCGLFFGSYSRLSLPVYNEAGYIRSGIMPGNIQVLSLLQDPAEINFSTEKSLFPHHWFHHPGSIRSGDARSSVSQRIHCIFDNFRMMGSVFRKIFDLHQTRYGNNKGTGFQGNEAGNVIGIPFGSRPHCHMQIFPLAIECSLARGSQFSQQFRPPKVNSPSLCTRRP